MDFQNTNEPTNLPAVVEEPKDKEPEDKNNKKKGRYKQLINILFVLVVTAVALIITLWGDNFTKIVDLLKTCSWGFVFIALGFMLGAICVKALIYVCFARLYLKKYYFHQALAVEQIGDFYSAVTPGATGGQIMESFTFRKQGIPVSSAVSIMAMTSIMYQVALILYGTLAFIIKYDFINAIGSIDFQIAEIKFSIPILVFTIIGYVFNVSLIGVILLMSYSHHFHNFIMGPCIGLLHKIKLVKKPDETRENLRVSVENFKIELRRLLTNIPFTILVLVLYLGFFTLKFGIPYFCGLALGNASPKANFMDAVFLGNYHYMVTALIPLPGSAGISEYFFVKLFSSYNSDINSAGFFAVIDQATNSIDVAQSEILTRGALLLWRTVTFTFPLIIAGFVTAFYKHTPKDDEEMPTGADRKTFLSLQKATYAQRAAELRQLEITSSLSRKAVLDKLRQVNKKEKEEKHVDTKMEDINTDDEDDL